MYNYFGLNCDVLQVYKSQLVKFLHLTCPNSECGKMKTHQAGSFPWETLLKFFVYIEGTFCCWSLKITTN